MQNSDDSKKSATSKDFEITWSYLKLTLGWLFASN